MEILARGTLHPVTCQGLSLGIAISMERTLGITFCIIRPKYGIVKTEIPYKMLFFILRGFC